MPNLPITNIDKGLDLSKPNILISPGFTSDCKNIICNDGIVSKSFGYVPFNNQQLNGTVLALKHWRKLNLSQYLLCFTTKDAYKWNGGTLLWELITPTYTTGTVAVTNASPTVTGTGTVWTTNAKVGDKFTVTGDTVEYEILSIASDTSLTLTTNYSGTTGTGKTYTIRKLFTATSTDSYSFESYVATGDYVLIITNGIDNIYKWNGSGNLQLLGGASNYKAKYVIAFANHLHILNTIESGTAYPQRDRWSNIGDADVWSGGDSGFVDLVENSEHITGCSKTETIMVIYKENSITICRWIGSPSLYNYNENMVVGVGLKSPKTLQSWRNKDIFLSKDGVYKLEGSTMVGQVDQLVNKELIASIDSLKFEQCFSSIDYYENIYNLYTPSGVVWSLNLVNDSWTKQYIPDIQCASNYRDTNIVTIDGQPSGSIDTTTGRIDDLEGAAQLPLIAFGKTGYTFKADRSSYNQSNSIVQSYWTTYNILADTGDIRQKNRYQVISFEAMGTGIALYYSVDDGISYYYLETVTLSSYYTQYNVYHNIVSPKIIYKFQNEVLNGWFKLKNISISYQKRSIK